MNGRAAAVVGSVLPSWPSRQSLCTNGKLSKYETLPKLVPAFEGGGGGRFFCFSFSFFFIPFLSFLSFPSPPHGLHFAVRYRTLHIVHTCYLYYWLIDWLLIGKPLEKEGRKEGRERKKEEREEQGKKTKAETNKQKASDFITVL